MITFKKYKIYGKKNTTKNKKTQLGIPKDGRNSVVFMGGKNVRRLLLYRMLPIKLSKKTQK